METKDNSGNNRSSEGKRVYSAEDIACMLDISKRAAYNVIDRTESLQVICIGKSKRVLRESFDNWISGRTDDMVI